MCPNDNKLHLVYASDANYVLYLEVAIRAAYFRTSRPADLIVHVLDCGIPNAQWESFVQRIGTAEPTAHLERHIINMEQFDKFPGWNGSRATYARLCLPSILSDVDWCVYADVDTLFVDDPLELISLYDPTIALQGALDRIASKGAQKWYERNGIPLSPEEYVCAGFILINLAWFRKHDMERRALQFLSEHQGVPFPDQDALNILCAGNKRLLPDGWGNFSFQPFGVERLKCIHFAGTFEPPWRATFSWRRGYRECIRIWYHCAETLVGVPRHKVSKISGCRWWIGLIYTQLLKWAVWTLSSIPGIKRWMRFYEGRFPSRKHAYLFHSDFWHR